MGTVVNVPRWFAVLAPLRLDALQEGCGLPNIAAVGGEAGVAGTYVPLLMPMPAQARP